MKRKILLIDGDAILWRTGWIFERSQAQTATSSLIDDIVKATEATHTEIYLGSTDKTNYRYAVYDKYKANRKGAKRPPNERTVRKYLIEKCQAKVVTGAEADDALGIRQTECLKKQVASVIASNDKDLDMIPGEHYDMDFGRKVMYRGKYITRKAYKKKQIYTITDPGFLALRQASGRPVLVGGGQKWFCAQLLLGDTADGIPSMYKMTGTRYGHTRVFKLLQHAKTFASAIKICYNEYKLGLGDEALGMFERNAKLLWIKRERGKEEIYLPEWVK